MLSARALSSETQFASCCATVDIAFFLIFVLDAKCQVLANLANFAYDPINYPHLKKLNVAELFLGKFSKLSLA